MTRTEKINHFNKMTTAELENIEMCIYMSNHITASEWESMEIIGEILKERKNK